MRSGLFSRVVADDAGAAIPLIDTRSLVSDDRAADPDFQRVLDRVARIRLSGGLGWRVGVGAVVAQMLLLVLITFEMPGSPLLVQWGLGIVIFLPPVFIAYRWRRRGEAAQVAGVLLADGLCARCAYNLGAQVPDAEGLVTCPECSSRWREQRMQRRNGFDRSTVGEGRTIGMFLVGATRADETTGPKIIADDTGRRFPVVAARLRAPAQAATGDHKVRLERARHAILRHGRRGRIVTAIAAACLFGGGMISSLVSSPPTSAVELLLRLCAVLMMAVFVPVMILRGGSGINAKHIRRAMLANQLCPSCAADMASIEPDPVHGARICSDCGAIWGFSATLHPPSECRACRYPIADLRPDERGMVVCPECGAAEPFTTEARARELVRCPSCRAPLGGKQLRAHGQVQCPACELWTSRFTQHELDTAGAAQVAELRDGC